MHIFLDITAQQNYCCTGTFLLMYKTTFVLFSTTVVVLFTAGSLSHYFCPKTSYVVDRATANKNVWAI